MPRILQTLEALSGSKELQSLRLKLLKDLWIIEDRAYPYLEKAFYNDQLNTEDFIISKSLAIEAVCMNK